VFRAGFFNRSFNPPSLFYILRGEKAAAFALSNVIKNQLFLLVDRKNSSALDILPLTTIALGFHPQKPYCFHGG